MNDNDTLFPGVLYSYEGEPITVLMVHQCWLQKVMKGETQYFRAAASVLSTYHKVNQFYDMQMEMKLLANGKRVLLMTARDKDSSEFFKNLFQPRRAASSQALLSQDAQRLIRSLGNM